MESKKITLEWREGKQIRGNCKAVIKIGNTSYGFYVGDAIWEGTIIAFAYIDDNLIGVYYTKEEAKQSCQEAAQAKYDEYKNSIEPEKPIKQTSRLPTFEGDGYNINLDFVIYIDEIDPIRSATPEKIAEIKEWAGNTIINAILTYND